MYRLFSLSALLLMVSGDPRTPKIYNVLISTKKNLSPSHALPVYEPVLRTTSLGIALPPLFYQTPLAFEPGLVSRHGENKNEDEEKSLQPLPVERFIPYYAPILHPGGYYAPVQSGNPPQTQPNLEPKPDDPKNVIANLKRNPDIPDVPPPALPTRNSAQS